MCYPSYKTELVEYIIWLYAFNISCHRPEILNFRPSDIPTRYVKFFFRQEKSKIQKINCFNIIY